MGTSGWPPLAELPTDARQAVLEVQQLAATSRDRGGSWYRKAFTVGRAALDLHDPGQLDLLRRCGPFSTDARVWVEDDPMPVIESTETLDGAPRFTYRLDPWSWSAYALRSTGPAWPAPAWCRAAPGPRSATEAVSR